MTCREAEEHLVELLYGELAAEPRQRIEQHLAGCPSCQAVWRTLREAYEPVEKTAGDGPSRRIDVAQVYESLAARSQRNRRRWQMAALLTGLAASLLLTAAVFKVRVEVAPTHLTFGWGDQPPPQPSGPQPPPIEDLRPALRQLSERLAAADELARLIAEQFLAAEADRAAELTALHRELDTLRRETSAQLVALEQRGDRRWRLIAEALMHPETIQANYVPGRDGN